MPTRGSLILGWYEDARRELAAVPPLRRPWQLWQIYLFHLGADPGQERLKAVVGVPLSAAAFWLLVLAPQPGGGLPGLWNLCFRYDGVAALFAVAMAATLTGLVVAAPVYAAVGAAWLLDRAGRRATRRRMGR
jgi:hypothetical protein